MTVCVSPAQRTALKRLPCTSVRDGSTSSGLCGFNVKDELHQVLARVLGGETQLEECLRFQLLDTSRLRDL